MSNMNDATKAKYSKAPITNGVLWRFPRALKAIAEVSAWGTRKHNVPIDDLSYLDLPRAYEVYTDAVGRHLLAEGLEGPINEEDAGLYHAAQLAWNALARLEIFLRNQELEAQNNQARENAREGGQRDERPAKYSPF